VPPATPRIRASVVCRRGAQLLTIQAVDPFDGMHYLFLPGGEIEPGESPAAAAERETLEETGYAVRVVEPALVFDYDFMWAGKPYACRTYFFRAALIDPAATPGPVNDDGYIQGVEWTPVAHVDKTFAYHATIRDAVRQLL